MFFMVNLVWFWLVQVMTYAFASRMVNFLKDLEWKFLFYHSENFALLSPTAQVLIYRIKRFRPPAAKQQKIDPQNLSQIAGPAESRLFAIPVRRVC